MWAVEIEAAFDQAGRRSRTWASPLRRLRPPPGREALHARVLALGRRGAADEGTAAWAKRAAARFAEIEAIRRELAGARVSDAERRYAIAVDDVLSDRLYSYDEAVGQAEAAIARARRRLERARPPRAAARAHADVVDAFVAEGVAYRTMLAACRDGDPAAARAAAERADAAGAAVERAWTVLLDALGGELRRPAARTTDEASRS